MDIRQCFELFDIEPESTITDIKRAYRDIVRVWHPDRFPENDRIREKAGKKLAEYNEAYEKLLAHYSAGEKFADEKPEPPESTTHFAGKRILSVASGKGGVGKTNFTVNVAIALNQMKEKVTVFDADLGMANIDVLCGLNPKYHLGDALEGKKRLSEVVLDVFNGVKVIPGVSGIENLTSLDPEQRLFFFRELNRYDETDRSDFVFIDNGAGMGPTVIGFMAAAPESIIVTTPEPTAMMDAYALIKTVHSKRPDADINIVVNMVRDREEGERIFSSMKRITKTFLDYDIQYLGHIAHDKSVPRAVKRQKPWILSSPYSPSSVCIREIARRLIDRNGDIEKEDGVGNLFRRMAAGLKELWTT